MYFKRLELVGFKSFMDKTVLNFEPGITAVVGPNGCGKSNIFDAIRWVLGEQSVKSLRGSQMEDVIFNGTDTKQPLGMAEVSLTFDNEGKHFTVDHDEVMITRRIFRSGESEYLINKAQVRLKDIQDLLLGTGIGAESYSIIAQGKIDLILSSKPEDRRMVFDEASGITKYKAQKREALRKLEETEQNLLRLNDIITEVRRSIGYLERQANKARRYQATFEELKNREINLALLQKDNLIKEKYEITRQIGILKENEETIQSEIKEEENRITQAKIELESLEADLASIKNLIHDSQNFIQRNNQQINFNHERIEESKSTAAYLGTQILQTKDRLAKDEEKLAKLKEEYFDLKKSLEEKSLSLKESQGQLDNIVVSIKTSLETIAQAKKNILELVQKISLVKNELADLTSRQQVCLARKKRLDIEKAKVIEEKTQVEDNLNTLLAEFLQLEKDCGLLKLRICDVKTELERETATLSQINEEIDGLEKQRLSLQSQKEFLEKLKSQYEDINESMNAQIYLDKLPKEKITGLVVKIKDYDTLAYAESSNFKLSGEAKPIDLDAQRINEKIKEIEEKLAVLKNNKQSHESHIQALNTVIQELSSKGQEQEVALANKRTVHHSALEQFKKIKEEEEIIVLELSDVENEITSLEEKLNALKANLAELEKENQFQDDTIHNQQESINSNAKLKEEVLVVITQLKTEIENLTKDLDAEDSTFKMQEEAARQNRENILHQETKLKETQDRQVSLVLDIEGLEEKNIVLRQEIETHTSCLGDEEQRHKELQDSSNEIVKRIDEKKQKHDQLKDNAYQLQMVQKDLDFKYQSIKDRLLSAYKADLDTVEVASSAQATQDVRPEGEISAQELPTTDQVKENTPAPTVVLETDEAKLAAEIEKLKERIESYGTVNLVAIEEYDELKKRYDFLTQQQTDLVTAKESLQEAIQKINRTTRKMFIETFEKVREEFRNYFRMLFNGGDAQVFLIDENDPLESGIEIICRPPGKKLQNVLLLSGGEKALAAIALIFAIFKVKPAPFCVLDEIDAALDESNVDRFGRLLQEFSGTSQFIVITHNKRTIANAGIMYGITMQESGVSKIVSVKFASDKKKEKTKAPEPVAA
jgi:chromosome segregation protein